MAPSEIRLGLFHALNLFIWVSLEMEGLDFHLLKMKGKEKSADHF